MPRADGLAVDAFDSSSLIGKPVFVGWYCLDPVCIAQAGADTLVGMAAVQPPLDQDLWLDRTDRGLDEGSGKCRGQTYLPRTCWMRQVVRSV